MESTSTLVAEFSIDASSAVFISSFIGQNYSGGSVAAARNLELCRQLFAGMQVDAYGFFLKEPPLVKNVNYLPSHPTAASTFVNYSFGNAGSLTFANIKKLLSIFETGNYTAVFLDGSLLGKLAKKIKQRNSAVTIVSFFHNVEREFFKAKLLLHPLWLPLYLSACYNERLSSIYSTCLFCFNERDAAGIEKYYGKKIDAILPATVTDRLNCAGITEKDMAKTNRDVEILFVGSDFFANTNGLKWFVRQVMPHVKARLTVAGKGMEKYRDDLGSEQVKILGTVEHLDVLYYAADVVVAPIFSGSGMKLKMAEALMMGKVIAGTPEAWEGYKYKTQAGFICKTAGDFIAAINSISGNFSRYNKSSRMLYEQLYSPQSQQQAITRLKDEIKQHVAL